MSDRRFSFVGNKTGFPFRVKEFAEDGLPFEEWDGSTVHQLGSAQTRRPSKSSSELITVYGAGSYYCIPLTFHELMSYFWRVKIMSLRFTALPTDFGTSISGDAVASGLSISLSDFLMGSSGVIPADEQYNDASKRWVVYYDEEIFDDSYVIMDRFEVSRCAQSSIDHLYAGDGTLITDGSPYPPTAGPQFSLDKSVSNSSPPNAASISYSIDSTDFSTGFFPESQRIIKAGDTYWLDPLKSSQLHVRWAASNNFDTKFRRENYWADTVEVGQYTGFTAIPVVVKLSDHVSASGNRWLVSSLSETDPPPTYTSPGNLFPTLSFEAVEYWPYAKPNGDPLFNTTTGVEIP